MLYNIRRVKRAQGVIHRQVTMWTCLMACIAGLNGSRIVSSPCGDKAAGVRSALRRLKSSSTQESAHIQLIAGFFLQFQKPGE